MHKENWHPWLVNARMALPEAGLGALMLCGFSALQKALVGETALLFQPRAYIVAMLYGGLTGWLIGLGYARLRRSRRELSKAYDSTLEGWARAVEMRDHSTESHTRRVVVLSERLARLMRMPESRIIHLRRGAMLHDIGKIGVPDAILNKPGPLTDAERAIMREHPGRAYEMLAHIEFLHEALEIPYCHHEHWDGSGYPRGLRGEQIPLAARIFSVVDVFDALTSERPYRQAWSEQAALDHIRAEAGRYFDPSVVQAFLENLKALKSP